MPYLPQQRVLLPGVQSSDLTSGKIKSGLGKDALASGGMDSLATVIVPSGGISTITFAGIPSGYKHLQIRSMAVNTAGATGNYASLQFNGDTGSNYSWHLMTGNGASYATNNNTSTTSIRFDQGLYATSSNTYPQYTIFDILDYASPTKAKTTRALDGGDANGAGFIALISGAWYSTDAVRTISIYSFSAGSASTFGQNSHFALYGVR